MYAELIDTINSVAATCEEKFNINSGGCCYFAYLVARELDKRKIKYKLAIEDWTFSKKFCKTNRLKARKALKSRQSYVDGNSLVNCNHFTLMVGGELVNYESSWGSEVILISYVNSEDIDWIYKTGRWNDFYKRKNNPTVERMVIKAFNEYEKRIQEKEVYVPVKSLFCARCQGRTSHSLCDYENKIYKCNICKTVRSV